jgi:hypothetical protein
MAAGPKTRATTASVTVFLESVGEDRREDCKTLLRIMKKATRAAPRMWGPSIVGFGSYRYEYDSGREGDWFLAGFSPRKQDLTIYITSGFDRHEALLARLGKHRTGKSCLYVKRLADIDLGVLEALVSASITHPLGKAAPQEPSGTRTAAARTARSRRS